MITEGSNGKNMTKNVKNLTKWWMWEGGNYIIILILGLYASNKWRCCVYEG